MDRETEISMLKHRIKTVEETLETWPPKSTLGIMALKGMLKSYKKSLAKLEQKEE